MLETIMSVGKWLAENYANILGILLSFVIFAEGITRLTPTKKDDGFVERVGSFIRGVMDALKIPNVKKK